MLDIFGGVDESLVSGIRVSRILLLMISVCVGLMEYLMWDCERECLEGSRIC